MYSGREYCARIGLNAERWQLAAHCASLLSVVGGWVVQSNSLQLLCAMLTVTCFAAPTCHLPPAACHLPPATLVAALHKLANNVEQSGSRIVAVASMGSRLAVFLLLSLLPPFTAFCTCVMHFHAIYNSFPRAECRNRSAAGGRPGKCA